VQLADPGYYMQGGLWGGPLAHLALLSVVAALCSSKRRALLDTAALSLPLPMAVAKVACFCNGCCHGAAGALFLCVSHGENPGGAPVGVRIHPVQLYEVVALAVIFAVLLRLRQRSPAGRLFAWFLMMYGVSRGLTEFLRGDGGTQWMFGALTLSQLLCFAAAITAAVALYVMRAGPERSARGGESAA